MKVSPRQERWLRAFHWDELVDLSLSLRFVRHQLIQSVNDRVETNAIGQPETLGRLAEVDEALAKAGVLLDQAKQNLFDICREGGARKY